MEFWRTCFNKGYLNAEFIRQAVITIENPYGDITPEQFKEITGEDFIKEDQKPKTPGIDIIA